MDLAAAVKMSGSLRKISQAINSLQEPLQNRLKIAFAESIVSSETPGGDRGTGDQNNAPSASSYAGAGLQFAVALVLFVLAGDWVDEKLGTSPVFLLVGVFGGGAASFYSMYKKLMAPYARKPEKQ